ncbi:alcohol dehydrogenase [Coprinopsis sp. MPI-PUGE-AT-0042]|nr:alcohol dehydrogenase [Coprinopsis sp. MPI-PUGE-AT-0042]
MAANIQTTSRWVLRGQKGVESLQLQQNVPIPPLGETEVLVQIHAASLNHRDVAMAKGAYGQVSKEDVIPGSDGAGIVVAVGPNVVSFKPGDKVVTHMTPHLPADAVPDFADIRLGMGQIVDGTLTTHGIFTETALVRMPKSLDFDQASTLCCSALTAHNALFGVPSHAPTKGSWVLVQGTGGVSIAALQFAVAVGANVIATTGSDAKKKRLEELGAKHVLNYRNDPKWGETAKSLTPGGVGLDVVVDVGGLNTLGQSLKAAKVDGLVSACGLLGSTPEGEEAPNVMAVFTSGCMLRGVLLGSRTRFQEMCEWIDEIGFKPVVDDRIFKLEELQDAYRYVEEQKHFSKIVIRTV